jgi:hypothetical protein
MGDMTMFWVIIGLGLLFSALVAALKIGLWVWIATRFFGRPEPPMTTYDRQPVVRPKSFLDGLKKWLTIIGAVLGIISTTVGLVKGCEDDPPDTGRLIMPHQPQKIGYRCCTPQATCQLFTGGMPVGSPCTCVGMFGGISGRVCE